MLKEFSTAQTHCTFYYFLKIKKKNFIAIKLISNPKINGMTDLDPIILFQQHVQHATKLNSGPII